ncbi:MAG: Tim44 domain-containing protein [Proteobacteria bacterium]|nr:Tim44 domain-containing protein [Pseudomonadota bacterium]
MGEGFQFFEILLFAGVAVFIILRLRRVLGRRQGQERPPAKSFIDRTARQKDDDNVVSLPDRSSDDAPEDAGPAVQDATAQDATAQDSTAQDSTARDSVDEEPENDLAVGIADIRASDTSFDPENLLQGARTAYDMVLTSFASGDTDTLRALLDDDVYDDFQRAIVDRDSRKETLETTVVAIKSADLIEAATRGRLAEVTVKFVSELVNVTRDANNEVLSGDPRSVQEITDFWTFLRDMRSNDPNWKLIATRTEN